MARFNVDAAGGSSNSGNASFTEVSAQTDAQTPTLSGMQATGWVSYGFPVNSPSQITFSGLYAITGPTAAVSVGAALLSEAGTGAQIDFSMDSIGISAPAGVLYTSDSGIFDTIPSPEPGSIAVLAPLAWMAARRGRRS
jgi:hypothetical protein